MKRKEYLKHHFTEEGVIALENRLQNLAKLFIKEDIKYPFIARTYGFPNLEIKSKQHHQGMMDNLQQILMLNEIIIKR